MKRCGAPTLAYEAAAMKQLAGGEQGMAAFGPKRSVRAAPAHRRHGGRSGAVPPFSGPRSRGSRRNARASAASSPAFSPERPGHREWGLRPCPKPPALGTSEVGEDGVRQYGCRRAVVVPPGAGPIRGRAPSVPGTGGADAAERCGARWCPASVGRRTGAPPPPCHHDAGLPTLRGQKALGRKAPHTPHPIRCVSS